MKFIHFTCDKRYSHIIAPGIISRKACILTAVYYSHNYFTIIPSTRGHLFSIETTSLDACTSY